MSSKYYVNVPCTVGWVELECTQELSSYNTIRLGVQELISLQQLRVRDARWWRRGEVGRGIVCL